MVVLITLRQQQRWWLVQQTQSQHHNQGSSNPSCSWFWFFHSWFCKKIKKWHEHVSALLKEMDGVINCPIHLLHWDAHSVVAIECVFHSVSLKKKISLSYWCINGLLSTAILVSLPSLGSEGCVEFQFQSFHELILNGNFRKQHIAGIPFLLECKT